MFRPDRRRQTLRKQYLKTVGTFTAETLSLQNTGVDDNDAILIAEDFLTKNTQLEKVSLPVNKIGDSGAIAISKALQKHTKLNWLNLGGNRISDGGALAVAEMLKKTTTQGELDLWLYDNAIGDKGAIAIAGALKDNATTQLRTLGLGGNKFGDKGFQAVADALESNTMLQQLYLRGMDVGDDGAFAMAGMIEKNTTLLVLVLDGDRTSAKGSRAIADALEKNATLFLRGIGWEEITGDRFHPRVRQRTPRNVILHPKDGDDLDADSVSSLPDANVILHPKDGDDLDADSVSSLPDANVILHPKDGDDLDADSVWSLPDANVILHPKDGDDLDADSVSSLPDAASSGDFKADGQEQSSIPLKPVEPVDSTDAAASRPSTPVPSDAGDDLAAQLAGRMKLPETESPPTGRRMQFPEVQQQLRNHMARSGRPQPVVVPAEYVDCIISKEVIGEGFFGVVYNGYDKELDLRFAVKTNRVPLHLLDPDHLKRLRKSFQTELKTLHEFNHPNIVTLLGYCITDDLQGEQFLLYELAEKGTLQSFLASEVGRERLCSFHRRTQIAIDVMTALQFLHDGTAAIKCFHRDVKPHNIVLMRDMTAKLTDCGLAKLAPQNRAASGSSGGSKGTDEYMCPLYQRNKLKEFLPKCDIFSFGVVLAELWTGLLQSTIDQDGETVDLYEKFSLDGEDIVANIDGALDIEDLDEPPLYAIKFAKLSLECMSRRLEDRPQGRNVLVRLRQILDEREKVTDENADAKEMLKVEYPPASSVKMQCQTCRMTPVRCYATPDRYLCLPCLLKAETQKITAEILCSRQENNQLHQSIHAKLDSLAGVMASLDARLVNRIPTLFVLVPAERAVLARHPRSWLRDQAKIKYRIYFVCAHSFRRVQSPVKFRVSKVWISQIAPVLACSLYALHLAAKSVTGLDLRLGSAAETIFHELGSQKIYLMLESMLENLDESGKNHDLVQSLRKASLGPSEISQLDKESIDPIVEFASAQRDWFREMKHVHHAGKARSMWVLNEYANQYSPIT